MTWSFGDSFDLYAAAADLIAGYWDSGAGTPTFVAGRFTGSQALQIAATTVSLIKNSGVNDAVHHLVVAYRQTAALSGTTLGAYLQLLDGTTGQCAIVFRSDGAILLTSGTAAGATLATYTGAVAAANTWYAFEFEVSINSTTGVFNVRKNGNTVNDFSATALNTRPTSTNNYANKLTFGMQATVNAQQFDDLFWQSGAATGNWLGDIRCITRMPASDVQKQFTAASSGVLSQVAGQSNSSRPISNTTAYLTQFTSNFTGLVTSVGVSIPTGNSGNMKCAIYADNGSGIPIGAGTLAVAPVTPVVNGTNTFTFSPGFLVTKGVNYWVAAISDTATGTYTCGSTTTGAGTWTAVSYALFPQTNPTTSGSQAANLYSWIVGGFAGNWQTVADAQQDGLTSYVYDSTPGDQDFYGIANIASTPAAVIATTLRAYAEKSDAGTRTLAVQLKSGATVVASPTLVLTTSGFQWAWRTDLTDPNTGAAWTPAAVNNAQIGPKVIA